MREGHCDSLKNLSVPAESVQKALMIPAATPAPAPKKSIWSGMRIAAIAAAFLLVSALGIFSYFAFRNMGNTPIAVSPATENTSHPTEKMTDPTPTDPVDPTHPPTVPTAPPVVLPSVVPTQPPTRFDPPVSENQPDPPAHTETPTQQAVIPSENHSELSDDPTELTDEPIDPALDPTEKPPHSSKEAPAAVGYMVPLSSYNGSGDIFCRMYNSSGRLVGSEDLFDDSHLVYSATASEYLLLSYPLGNIGEPLPGDNYTLVFYDENLNDFYVCSAFLSRQ